jgi:hypothetical protein
MPMDGLSLERGLASTMASRWDVAQAIHRSMARNSGDHNPDHRLLADLIPTEFRDHPVLGYEILTWESDLPNPSLYLPIPVATAHEKARLLAHCYPSKAGCGWVDDDEAFLGLMRVRGVQCRARYAEAFTVQKSVSHSGSDYSVN